MTEKPMIIRDARRADVPAIVQMLADDTLGRARERYEAPLPQAYWDAFDAIAHSDDTRLLVAEIDGAVIGTMQIYFLHGLARQGALRAQIEAVRIASSHTGRGLGRRMIAAAIEMARGRGCAMIQLTSDKSRTDAHRFYEKLGFVASHEGMKLMLAAPALPLARS
jgi:GNAT superfamily N-acetyltransferase